MSQDPPRTIPEILDSMNWELEKVASPALDRIATALETIVEQGLLITPDPVVVNQFFQNNPQFPDHRASSPETHAGEESVADAGDDSVVVLPDGRTVPIAVIEALDEFEGTWPGATLKNARPGLAWAMISAYDEASKAPKTGGETLCLNDDFNIREKASPCILDKNHGGQVHKDNLGGEWLV